MRKQLLTVVGAIALSLVGSGARAADHLDAPGATSGLTDLSTDINDVYAWTDGNNVNLVMSVNPNATATTKFSDAVRYAFHVNAATRFGDPTPRPTDIICTFAIDQTIKCWVVNGTTVADYVTGNASAVAGLVSKSAKVKVFAGLRNDAFFFNIQGFKKVVSDVKGAAGPLTTAGAFNQQGCPNLEKLGAGTTAAVAGHLAKQADGTTAGVDDFTKDGHAAAPTVPMVSGNVMAIVVQIDKSLVTTATQKVLGVWASTHK
jgi:hypothetical protein